MKTFSKAGDYPETDNTHFNFKYDVGATLGIGKSIPITNKNHLFVEIRDNLGLTNNSKFGEDFGKLKTNSFNLILGWTFDF